MEQILSENQTPQKNNRKKRTRVLIFLSIFFILSGLVYTFYYYSHGRYFVSTDNAYVGQNIIYVTPQTSGNIDSVNVSEMQFVKAGDLLAHIDSRNQQLAFEEAKSALAQTVRAVKKLQREKNEAEHALTLAQVKLSKSEDDLKRNSYLIKKGAITDEKYKDLSYAHEAAQANVQIARQKVLSLEAIVKDDNISNDPQVQNAALRLQRTYLDLKRCDIIAPVDGIIAKKSLTIGQSVNPSSTLLAIVPQEDFWVDANFKETQLQHIRLGQNVTLISDTYGTDMTYHGKVLGIAPGTGSIFSLIPAQNATGNWIKIVQRVPVRIALDAKEIQANPLQVGNSMNVTVDLHDQNGGKLARVVPTNVQSVHLYKDAMKEADEITKKIIEQNS